MQHETRDGSPWRRSTRLPRWRPLAPPSWTNAANMNGDFTAAAWALLKSLRHRETMTVFVETPAQTLTGAAPDGPHAGRRRIALGAIIALAGGCSLVLL